MAIQDKGKLIHKDNLKTMIDYELCKQYNRSEVRKNFAIPLCINDNKTLYIVNANDDIKTADINALTKKIGFNGNVANIKVSRFELLQLLHYMYDFSQELDTLHYNILQNKNSNVADLTNLLLEEAIVMGASDIHFEPTNGDVRVRYRVLGRLIVKTMLPIAMWQFIKNRIKVLASMSLADHKRPCDGRFNYTLYDDHIIDVRVASQMTIWGENFVLRLLGGKKRLLDFKELGFDAATNELLLQYSGRKSGMFMVSGPVGSGKTTTLYALLAMLRDESVNIVTLEDPVEYQMDMICQTQVNDLGGLSFAQGIRSILRQDPDIILIGEIRDEESAQAAIRASMLGHLVFTTVHAKDTKGAFNRLRTLGVDQSIINDHVICAMTQRLIRIVCDKCVKYSAFTQGDVELFKRYKLSSSKQQKAMAIGCENCFNTGFKERGAIGMMATPQQSVCNQNHQDELLINGLRLIADGLTTMNELQSVLDVI